MVAEEFGCEEKTIVSKGRKKNMAHDMAIYCARNLTDESRGRLGEYFGGISGAGITARYIILSKKIDTTPKLNKRVRKLKLKTGNN